MGYVMVPVPEEHVEQAMTMILRLVSRARLEPWDQEAVTALFEEVDEASRSVLSATARNAIAGNPTSDHVLAESIDLPQREVLGIVRELNEISNNQMRVPIIVVIQETQTLPNGRTREQRMVSVEREIAPMIREAEQAELAANPHPLLGGPG